MEKPAHGPFPSARDEAEEVSHEALDTAQTRSPAYRLAFEDRDFLLRDEARPVRLQLELLKPELLLQEQGIDSTIAVFGSARLTEPATAEARLREVEKLAREHPSDTNLARAVAVARRTLANSRYYEEARRFGALVSRKCGNGGPCDFVILTGGGPGIMEAANRGAHEVGAKNVGLNIVVPAEERPNHYVTPELCFRFHYFAIRKMHFLTRAKALVVFPGGFGTLDELFEAATLIQTGKIEPIPFLLFGREYWRRVVNLDVMVEEGMIAPEDKHIFRFVETAEEAWQHIAEFYGFDEGGDDGAQAS